MQVSLENLREAQDAIRDILYLFTFMVEEYGGDFGGFGHNLDTGKFSALNFLDATEASDQTYKLMIDWPLLHSGSAISLLCRLSDFWDDYEISPRVATESSWHGAPEVRSALAAGRFDHLPTIKPAVVLAFGDDQQKFREALVHVYQEHVLGYFRRLAAG